MYAFFLREKTEVPIVTSPVTSWWWLLSKQPTKTEWATILRTPRKTTSKENCDHIADWNLQGEGWYLCLDRNSGVETDKEAAPHKSIGDRPLIPELSSNTLMLPATCLLQGKKRGTSPNFTPVCSDQRPDIQTKQNIVHSLPIPTAGPRRKNWDCFASPLQELKLLDK